MSRFEHLGTLADINSSLSLKEEAVRLTPDSHPNKPIYLSNLGNSLLTRYDRLGELADLDRSISVGEDAVSVIPDGHPDKPARLNNLGSSLVHRFGRLGDLGDIVRSISMQEEALGSIPNGHPNKPHVLRILGDAFMLRFQQSHDFSDLSAASFHFATASRASIGPAYTRFHAASGWIFSALPPPALLDAYATAIDLLPQLAWIGHPLIERHRLLVEAADGTRGADAAALEAGYPELAVEQLEQGRSIVWTQFLQLRDPVDELRVNHPALAHQFQRVPRELEHAGSRNRSMFQLIENNLTTRTRSLEDEVQRHHELAMRRDRLLIEIRSMPGFDRFLLPKTIEQLARLANSMDQSFT